MALGFPFVVTIDLLVYFSLIHVHCIVIRPLFVYLMDRSFELIEGSKI